MSEMTGLREPESSGKTALNAGAVEKASISVGTNCCVVGRKTQE